MSTTRKEEAEWPRGFHLDTDQLDLCVCVCACACVCVCSQGVLTLTMTSWMGLCVCAYVHECVCACVCVSACMHMCLLLLLLVCLLFLFFFFHSRGPCSNPSLTWTQCCTLSPWVFGYVTKETKQNKMRMMVALKFELPTEGQR